MENNINCTFKTSTDYVTYFCKNLSNEYRTLLASILWLCYAQENYSLVIYSSSDLTPSRLDNSFACWTTSKKAVFSVCLLTEESSSS